MYWAKDDIIEDVLEEFIINVVINCASVGAQEIVFRPDDYLRSLRALTRECVRAARSDAQALLPLARALAHPPPIDPPQEVSPGLPPRRAAWPTPYTC